MNWKNFFLAALIGAVFAIIIEILRTFIAAFFPFTAGFLLERTGDVVQFLLVIICIGYVYTRFEKKEVKLLHFIGLLIATNIILIFLHGAIFTIMGTDRPTQSFFSQDSFTYQNNGITFDYPKSASAYSGSVLQESLGMNSDYDQLGFKNEVGIQFLDEPDYFILFKTKKNETSIVLNCDDIQKNAVPDSEAGILDVGKFEKININEIAGCRGTVLGNDFSVEEIVLVDEKNQRTHDILFTKALTEKTDSKQKMDERFQKILDSFHSLN